MREKAEIIGKGRAVWPASGSRSETLMVCGARSQALPLFARMLLVCRPHFQNTKQQRRCDPEWRLPRSAAAESHKICGCPSNSTTGRLPSGRRYTRATANELLTPSPVGISWRFLHSPTIVSEPRRLSAKCEVRQPDNASSGIVLLRCPSSSETVLVTFRA